MNEAMGFLEVMKTGPGSSIQDLGRGQSSQWGIPISGPLDQISAAWVNHVLRNDPNSAVLEITQPGFSAVFHHPTRIAWAGAKARIFLNGKELSGEQSQDVQRNDTLEIKSFDLGSVVVLGVSGGFLTEKVLGSRSFYQGITPQPMIRASQQIPYSTPTQIHQVSFAKSKWSTDWFQSEVLDFYPGPDFGLLTESQLDQLKSAQFTLSGASSRMGVILEESLLNNLPELPTNPVFPGFVQLTSGGKLIILGPDAQVTGGYPRIMILTEKAQSILAQKKPKQKLRFRQVNELGLQSRDSPEFA